MRIAIVSLLLAVIAFIFAYLNPWFVTPLIIGLTYGIAALGVSVMARAGQISFGHAMYACIAAYSLAFIARAYPGTDTVVLIVVSVVISTLFSALVGVFVVKYRSIFFGMLNLALSMVLFALLGKMYEITGGTDGLRISRPTIFGIEFERTEFELILLVITILGSLLLAAVVQRYFKSGNGEALSAIKTNETRLEYLGVSAHRVMLKGYILSAAIVGFSGALLALIQGLVTPEIGMWLRSGEYVFITILGGAVHAAGAFVGAAIFESVKLLSSAYFPEFWQTILGITLILVIFLVPRGVVGEFIKRQEDKKRAR
ncbi:MAG: branched-chain amino acid ABC transporter permease [Alcaligenaceae bacterium]|nr:branched-chain amino acid ABC transporter permease [Alcaligenaceae bacterium]